MHHATLAPARRRRRDCLDARARRSRSAGRGFARLGLLVPFGQVVGIARDLVEPLQRSALHLDLNHVSLDPLDLDGPAQEPGAVFLDGGHAGLPGQNLCLIQDGARQVNDDPLRLLVGPRKLVLPGPEDGRKPAPARVGITLGHPQVSPPLERADQSRIPAPAMGRSPAASSFMIPDSGRECHHADARRPGSCVRCSGRRWEAAWTGCIDPRGSARCESRSWRPGLPARRAWA